MSPYEGICALWGRDLCSVFLHGERLAPKKVRQVSSTAVSVGSVLSEESQSLEASTQMSPSHVSQTVGLSNWS